MCVELTRAELHLIRSLISTNYGKNFLDISHRINNTFIKEEFGVSVGPGSSVSHHEHPPITSDTRPSFCVSVCSCSHRGKCACVCVSVCCCLRKSVRTSHILPSAQLVPPFNFQTSSARVLLWWLTRWKTVQPQKCLDKQTLRRQ